MRGRVEWFVPGMARWFIVFSDHYTLKPFWGIRIWIVNFHLSEFRNWNVTRGEGKRFKAQNHSIPYFQLKFSFERPYSLVFISFVFGVFSYEFGELPFSLFDSENVLGDTLCSYQVSILSFERGRRQGSKTNVPSTREFSWASSFLERIAVDQRTWRKRNRTFHIAQRVDWLTFHLLRTIHWKDSIFLSFHWTYCVLNLGKDVERSFETPLKRHWESIERHWDISVHWSNIPNCLEASPIHRNTRALS